VQFGVRMIDEGNGSDPFSTARCHSGSGSVCSNFLIEMEQQSVATKTNFGFPAPRN
jgi:hypothetical protein